MHTPRVIDLTLPVRDHFRWAVRTHHTQSHERGDLFQTSSVELSCHAFTHVDAPLHFVPGAPTVAEIELERWVGPAAVVDLSDTGADHGVSVDDLEARAAHLRPGEMVVLKTCWDRKIDVDTPEFWSRAPYVTRPAAEWLLARGARCVGYDFPPDHCIRDMVAGRPPGRRQDCVTHDVFLPNGVLVVEYLTNLDRLERERVFLVVAPLKLAADGAPARAFALDPDPT